MVYAYIELSIRSLVNIKGVREPKISEKLGSQIPIILAARSQQVPVIQLLETIKVGAGGRFFIDRRQSSRRLDVSRPWKSASIRSLANFQRWKIEELSKTQRGSQARIPCRSKVYSLCEPGTYCERTCHRLQLQFPFPSFHPSAPLSSLPRERYLL